MEQWLTMSKVVNSVKARLGAGARNLELDNDAIASVIRNETLPALSVYFPKMVYYVIDMYEDVVDKHQKGRYYVEWETPILGVEIITSLNGVSNATWYDRSFSICPLEFILSFMQKEITDWTTTPYTVHFLPPNQVMINPNPPYGTANKIAIKMKVAHKDFTEFHPGLREIIIKLCTYDVKLDILGMRRIFSNINTSMSDLELSMGTFEEADAKRDELIEKIRSQQHLSYNRRRLFVDQ